MKPAICTQCSANIEVDETHEAGICRFCGTAFITEKAITQYITQHETTHIVTNNITKVIYGNEKDEGEDFCERGLTFLRLENYGDAAKAFRRAVELSPERGMYHFYLAYTESQRFSFGFGTSLPAFFKLATPEEKAQVAEEYGLYTAGGYEDFVLDTVCRALTGDLQNANFNNYLNIALEVIGDSYSHPFKDLEGKEKTYRKLAAAIISRLRSKGPDFGIDANMYMQTQAKEYFGRLCKGVVPHMTAEETKEFFDMGGGKIFNPVENGALELFLPEVMPDFKDGVLRIDDPKIYSVSTRNLGGNAMRRLVIGKSFGRADSRIAYSPNPVWREVEYEEGFDFSRYFRNGDLPLPFLGCITMLPSSFPMTTATVNYEPLSESWIFMMALVFPEGYPVCTDGFVPSLQGICLPHISCRDGAYKLFTPGIIQGDTVYYPRLWKYLGKGKRADKLTPEQKSRFEDAMKRALGEERIAHMTFIDPSEKKVGFRDMIQQTVDAELSAPKKPGFFARLFGKK